MGDKRTVTFEWALLTDGHLLVEPKLGCRRTPQRLCGG